MAATSLTVPVMIVFSFVPMLSTFNESVRRAAKIVYTQQLSEIINGIGSVDISAEAVIVVAVNFAVGVLLFALAYRKKGL